jgi:hypothetical protein
MVSSSQYLPVRSFFVSVAIIAVLSISAISAVGAGAGALGTSTEIAGPSGSPYFAADADLTAVIGRIGVDGITAVTCRIKGQFIASTGGAWWYRLAIGYYAPAGDFWNGPENGTKDFLKDPNVDARVKLCPLAQWRNEIAGPDGSPYFMDANDKGSPAGQIAADATSQVACRIQGQYLASTGGSWWYRLRSGFYAPAGDFWNGPINGVKNFTKDPVVDFQLVACS